MNRLNKTELGQFDDSRCEQIQNEFESLMKEFLLKWQDVDTSDLQAILFFQMPWLINKYHMMHNMGRVMKEKGHITSTEAKTVKFVEEIVK